MISETMHQHNSLLLFLRYSQVDCHVTRKRILFKRQRCWLPDAAQRTSDCMVFQLASHELSLLLVHFLLVILH